MHILQANQQLVPSVARAPQERTTSKAASARLVLVIPAMIDPAPLAARVHGLAQARSVDVLIVGVSSSSDSEPELRRGLALLAAFLEEAGTRCELRVERGSGWLSSLQALIGESDILACCVPDDRSNAHEPYTQVLADRLHRPVYAFMESNAVASAPVRMRLELAPWLGSLAVIGGLTWLQILVARLGDNPGTTILMLLLVAVEVGLIWLSNALLS